MSKRRHKPKQSTRKPAVDPKAEWDVHCPRCARKEPVYEDPPDSEIFGCMRCGLQFCIEVSDEEIAEVTGKAPSSTLVEEVTAQGPPVSLVPLLGEMVEVNASVRA